MTAGRRAAHEEDHGAESYPETSKHSLHRADACTHCGQNSRMRSSEQFMLLRRTAKYLIAIEKGLQFGRVSEAVEAGTSQRSVYSSDSKLLTGGTMLS